MAKLQPHFQPSHFFLSLNLQCKGHETYISIHAREDFFCLPIFSLSTSPATLQLFLEWRLKANKKKPA